MRPSTIEWLRDILHETEFLEAQVAATTREVFLADEVLKRAFVRSVEVIGEAARKVPEDVRRQFPAVEWKKMAGMRDRLLSWRKLVTGFEANPDGTVAVVVCSLTAHDTFLRVWRRGQFVKYQECTHSAA